MANRYMDPKNQFLLTAGLGMMGQQFTKEPQNAFTGMGEAFSQGSGAFANALVLQQQQEDRDSSLAAKAKAERDQRQQFEAFKQAVAGSPNAALLIQMYQQDPAKAIETFYATQNQRPDLVGSDPFAGGADMDSVLLAMYPGREKGSLTPAETMTAWQMVQTEKMKRSRAVGGPVNVPEEYAGFYRKADDKMYTRIQEAGTAAMDAQQTLNVIRALSEQISSGGMGAEQLTNLQSGLQNVGLPDFDLSGELGMKEALIGAQKKFINQGRAIAPADSQFTKPDMIFWEAQTPGLLQTPKGRALLIEVNQIMIDEALNDMTAMEEIRFNDAVSPDRAMSAFRKDKLERVGNQKNILVNEDNTPTAFGQRILEANGQVSEGGKTVVRTGTKDGQKVRQLSDGTMEVQNTDGEWESL